MNPRVLFLTSHLPWPVEPGGSGQRTELLLRALRRRASVQMLMLPGDSTHERTVGNREQLRKGCDAVEIIQVPGLRRADRWQRMPANFTRHFWRAGRAADAWTSRYAKFAPAMQWIAERGPYDLIVSRYVRPAMLCGCIGGETPVLVDVDDVDWKVLESEMTANPPAGIAGRMRAKMNCAGVRWWCGPALRRCDHVWVTNENDLPVGPDGRTSILRNIPFSFAEGRAIEACRPNRESNEILFVGSMSHEPNAEGIEHFLKHVWPAVRLAVPQATVSIVGNPPSAPAAERWSAIGGVRILGYVQDLASLYEKCAFTISPVHYGGGTNIKLLESCVYGRAAVVTSHTMNGYRTFFEHGKSIWHGRTDAEFAEGCIRLLREPDLRDALAAAALPVVKSAFGYSEFERSVGDAMDRVLARGNVRASLRAVN